ncbi:MAG: phosphoglycerate dehydrogenase [Acidimicrobiales bacterium]|nr:phosphoglycerate dehydrogenase [Acidimicrobiales bacterium]
MLIERVLITSVPFGAGDHRPLGQLVAAGMESVLNPLGRKPTEEEMAGLVGDADAVIAGTEPFTATVLDAAPRLRLISRIGIGLDNVDLLATRERGIEVCYTPDAPTPAVAEMTIGLILTTLRGIHISNARMHAGGWHRVVGCRLGESVIGILGVGRVGREVLRLLVRMEPRKILLYDLVEDPDLASEAPETVIEWVPLDRLLAESDVLTVHLPMTSDTRGLIGEKELYCLKPDAVVVNTSRGGIVDEEDLHAVLISGHLRAAALDVFETEPYSGPLREVERCLLTSHMSSSSVDCRAQMEAEAAAEVVRFATSKPLANPVPESEYRRQEVK